MQLISNHNIPNTQSGVQSPGDTAEYKTIRFIAVNQHLRCGASADRAHTTFGYDQSSAPIHSHAHVDSTVPFMRHVLNSFKKWLGFLGKRALHSHSDGVFHKCRFCARIQTKTSGDLLNTS